MYNNPKYTGMKTMFVVESPRRRGATARRRRQDRRSERWWRHLPRPAWFSFRTRVRPEEHLEAYRELPQARREADRAAVPNHSPVDLAKILKQKGLDADPLTFILVVLVAFIAGVASVVDERQFHRPSWHVPLMGLALE